jgi:hypothetical protein
VVLTGVAASGNEQSYAKPQEHTFWGSCGRCAAHALGLCMRLDLGLPSEHCPLGNDRLAS